MYISIQHDIEHHTVWCVVNSVKASVKYNIEQGNLRILSTHVPEPISGQGIAAKLIKYTVDYALSNQLRPTSSCSYGISWLEKHPEYLK